MLRHHQTFLSRICTEEVLHNTVCYYMWNKAYIHSVFNNIEVTPQWSRDFSSHMTIFGANDAILER
jgi:uncharacterized membrane protein